MGKKIWLMAVFICFLLTGCGAAASDAQAQELEVASAAGDIAAPEEAVEEAAFSAEEPVVSEKASIRSNSYAYTGDKDGLFTDGLTYFTFSRNSVTHTDAAGEPLLLESLTQTSFYSECSIQTKWVNDLLTDLQASDVDYGTQLLEYAAQNQKDAGEAFYCNSHYVSRGIARHDGNIISLLSLTTVYSGGSNSYTTQTAFNLDMNQLKTLVLEDVVEPEGCGKLYELLLQKVEEKFASLGQSGALADHYKTILSDAVTYGRMTPYWYFNDQGLVIFFNPYELTPYAAGIVKIELSYSSLIGILKESYYPEAPSGWITNISVSGQQNPRQKAYDVKLGEGETLYVTISGTAAQVQLSEVTFVEQTPVDSTMLFSANRLNDETTLAVTAQPDPGKIYAVEYHDATGGPKILYFRDNKIVTDLQ